MGRHTEGYRRNEEDTGESWEKLRLDHIGKFWKERWVMHTAKSKSWTQSCGGGVIALGWEESLWTLPLKERSEE